MQPMYVECLKKKISDCAWNGNEHYFKFGPAKLLHGKNAWFEKLKPNLFKNIMSCKEHICTTPSLMVCFGT